MIEWKEDADIQQILQTVAKLAKNPPQDGSGPNLRVSPSSIIPPGPPGTAPGVRPIHLTRSERQQQQRSQPQQAGQSRTDQGHQTSSSFSQALPQAYFGTLAEPPIPKTIGQVRSNSQPVTHPQLQSQSQPPPTQNSESSATATGPPYSLTPKQVPRPASAQASSSSNQSQHSTQLDQQQQSSQSDRPTTSQIIRPPASGQASSGSGPIQASLNQSDTNSSLLAEWVEQRIQRPQLHQPEWQQAQVSQPPSYQYRPSQHQAHAAQQLPTPPQSANPLIPLMHGPQSYHQSAPDGNVNGSGIRFPGIGAPVNYGADGSGKPVQQMDNAMNQQPGQGRGDNDSGGPYYG